MSSLSIFENDIVPLNCGIKKLLPAERLMSFSILHYYTSFDPNFPKLNSHPVFISNQHIKHGYMQMKHPVVKAGYFNEESASSCWSPIIKKYEQKYIDIKSINTNTTIITTDESASLYTTSTSTISTTSVGTLNKYKEYSDIIHILKLEDENVLVKQKSTIYLIQNGKRHMIPSRKVFEDHGYSWDKVINCVEVEGFDALPVGSVLT